jgi:hypothetical protein
VSCTESGWSACSDRRLNTSPRSDTTTRNALRYIVSEWIESKSVELMPNPKRFVSVARIGARPISRDHRAPGIRNDRPVHERRADIEITACWRVIEFDNRMLAPQSAMATPHPNTPTVRVGLVPVSEPPPRPAGKAAHPLPGVTAA